MRRGYLIYNAVAGRRRSDSWAQDVIGRARAAGLTLLPRPTSGPGDATLIARRCATDSPDVVVVAGGDGTVGEAATGLLGSPIPLAIIPLGTANVLAREYGIGPSARRAERYLTSRRTRPLTAWRAANRTSFMWMGVGLDAHVMKNLSPSLKRRFGRAGIAITALTEFLRYDFPPIAVEGLDADGNPFAQQATFVVASNLKRYGGDPILSPSADPEDDLLALTLLTSRSRLALARFFLDVALGRTPHSRDVLRLSARTMTARSLSAKEVDVQVDGDYIGPTPATIGPIAGRALIVVPP